MEKISTTRITNLNLTKSTVESGYDTLKRIITSLCQFLTIVLILFVGIIGCSDVPYTGPVLTVDHVDRFLESTGEDTVCLQDGFDTICLRVLEQEEGEEEPPTVHIYPASVTFVFHYEDRPLLQAERVMDTTDVIQQLIDAGKVQLPPDAVGNSENNVDSNLWNIEIYYPESFPEANRGLTPETSGLDIRVRAGSELSANVKEDLKILDFEQFDKPNGIKGVRFSVETKEVDLTIQVNGIVSEFTAKFYMKADGVASEENAYSFELQPNDNP
ncbi:MAG: hypothetical protein OXD54_10550 [Candidatus Poribacteria bacterium]|nr:hypothetical protein [Candidatus Poribacteria bacterium]